MVCGLTKNNNGCKHKLNLFFLYGFKLCCAGTKTFNEIESHEVHNFTGLGGWVSCSSLENLSEGIFYYKAHTNKLHFEPPTLQKIELRDHSAHLPLLPPKHASLGFQWYVFHLVNCY